MTATIPTAPPHPTHTAEKAITLALRLAHAENALLALTSGQVDAIVDSDGHAYLLRPAQERLRQNEKHLQALLESSADGLMVVNRGGEILSQSHAVSRVLGCEPQELQGTMIFGRIHENDLAAFHFAFFNVLEGFDENATARFRHRAHDGSWRAIEATVARLRDASPDSVVFSMRPITTSSRGRTESARSEAASAQAALAKDRFLAILSHELRTPLMPVCLGVEELQQDERFAAARPTLTMIRRNLALQLRLLEELIDFTTVGQHKVRLRPETIDAHEAIRFVLEICQSEIAAAQIDVVLDLRAWGNLVVADSVKLQQVMWNLLKNAIKFSTPGSSISIATANDPSGRLAIEFTDHGIGIEAALLPLVFDSFQQGDLPGEQGKDGLGLGLFIAKGLAEAQGATLTALSAGRGKGSTFLLTLPLAPGRTASDTCTDAGVISPLSQLTSL